MGKKLLQIDASCQMEIGQVAPFFHTLITAFRGDKNRHIFWGNTLDFWVFIWASSKTDRAKCEVSITLLRNDGFMTKYPNDFLTKIGEVLSQNQELHLRLRRPIFCCTFWQFLQYFFSLQSFIKISNFRFFGRSSLLEIIAMVKTSTKWFQSRQCAIKKGQIP